jgi:Xaa-Pro aminopeptidase
MHTEQKLNRLRALMKKAGVQAYVVLSTDPHTSEYVPDCWQRRRWISGFTGSAGDVIVTTTAAAFWTDSRYFLQAANELSGSGILLMKQGETGTPDMAKWLSSKLRKGAKVGVDPAIMSHGQYMDLRAALAERGLRLVSIRKNLVDALWTDQPPMPVDTIQIHPVKYAGERFQAKLKKLRAAMADMDTKAHIITTLDSIAWLFNIRGTDVAYNPLAIAYAIVTDRQAILYTAPAKVTPKLIRAFGKQVQIRPYGEFRKGLKRLAERRQRIWVDSATVNQWVVDTLGTKANLLKKDSPIAMMKACKNPIELQGAHNAHLRDGVAMVNFLCWLEHVMKKGAVTEISAAEKLEEFRAKQDLFRGLSFETISGYAAHGAIVHYASSPETNVQLKPKGIYLIDSGAQYLDGTTDVTRTICLGTPTPEQKDRYTRVLKGHLALAMTRFPEGTTGAQVDTFARKALWDAGLDYGHGTGHGVGSYMGVHEGPQRVSPNRAVNIPLKPGMIISNEPGFYKSGSYGLRVENLMFVTNDKPASKRGRTFYRLQPLTLIPIDTNLIETGLMTDEEITYFNGYHAEVRKRLLPFLDRKTAAWLKRATRPIK